jgi:nucleotide-binding universal stress UspA family protein
VAKIIVSYDGTDNDTDALALAKLLASAGGSLSLAYVRHAHERERGKERLAQNDAEELLAAGARWLGDDDVPQHVVLSASTPEGLRELAEQERADVIVFGSAYRTTPGHVDPQSSAQRLLEGGPIAVALAPAGLREREELTVEKVAYVGDDGDPGPRETAESLAAAFGAGVVARANGDTGLVVVGSRAGTAAGRITLSAAAQYLIEMLRCPVLVLPHGVALRFDT